MTSEVRGVRQVRWVRLTHRRTYRTPRTHRYPRTHRTIAPSRSGCRIFGIVPNCRLVTGVSLALVLQRAPTNSLIPNRRRCSSVDPDVAVRLL